MAGNLSIVSKRSVFLLVTTTLSSMPKDTLCGFFSALPLKCVFFNDLGRLSKCDLRNIFTSYLHRFKHYFLNS